MIQTNGPARYCPSATRSPPSVRGLALLSFTDDDHTRKNVPALCSSILTRQGGGVRVL